jgi:hypothetical protein
MKNKEYIKHLLYGKTLVKSFLILIAALNFSTLRSQESIVKFYPSFGISAGFFDPGDVNKFIKNDISSFITSVGTTDIFAYYELHGGLTLRIKWLDINGFGEYATAPKWIVITNGNSRTYFFNRVTFGAGSNFYIPFGKRNNSFFMGGALHYNILMFKNFRASVPGFKVQSGVSLQFGKFNIQPYGAFNYARETDKSAIADFDLNYTGGQIGVYLSFHR